MISDRLAVSSTGPSALERAEHALMAEVVAGLRSTPPRISPRWFYDDLGTALFDAITRLPEYYPTRSELEILRGQGSNIGKTLPSGLAVVELGCGSAEKVAELLPRLRSPRGYFPIDVSGAALNATVREVKGMLPDLPVVPLRGDFTCPDVMRPLIARVAAQGPVLLFFPGSTIGNFEDDAAARLLSGLGRGLAARTPLLLGVDLIKERALLENAYDDAAGVTAAFNLNMLQHLNRRFGSDFDLRRFRHEARWVAERHRVEMWLRSVGDQRVHIGGATLDFKDGAGIHTESSHKWDRPRLDALASASGFHVESMWTDPRGYFAEVLLRRHAGD